MDAVVPLHEKSVIEKALVTEADVLLERVRTVVAGIQSHSGWDSGYLAAALDAINVIESNLDLHYANPPAPPVVELPPPDVEQPPEDYANEEAEDEEDDATEASSHTGSKRKRK